MEWLANFTGRRITGRISLRFEGRESDNSLPLIALCSLKPRRLVLKPDYFSFDTFSISLFKKLVLKCFPLQYFSDWGDGVMGKFLPVAKCLLIPLSRKNSSSRLPPTKFSFLPLNNNFHLIFGCNHCWCLFFLI